MTDLNSGVDQSVQEPQPPREQWPRKAWMYFAVLVLIWIGMYHSVKRAYFSNGHVLPLDDPYSWLALLTILVAFVSPLLVYFSVMSHVEDRDLARSRNYHNQLERKRQEFADAWVKEEIRLNHEKAFGAHRDKVDFGNVKINVPIPPSRPLWTGHSED
jgi:hypothetical protein